MFIAHLPRPSFAVKFGTQQLVVVKTNIVELECAFVFILMKFETLSFCRNKNTYRLRFSLLNVFLKT